MLTTLKGLYAVIAVLLGGAYLTLGCVMLARNDVYPFPPRSSGRHKIPTRETKTQWFLGYALLLTLWGGVYVHQWVLGLLNRARSPAA